MAVINGNIRIPIKMDKNSFILADMISLPKTGAVNKIPLILTTVRKKEQFYWYQTEIQTFTSIPVPRRLHILDTFKCLEATIEFSSYPDDIVDRFKIFSIKVIVNIIYYFRYDTIPFFVYC